MTTLDPATLPLCNGCQRPVRPQRAPATPGTVRYGAKGQCSTCYQRGFRAEVKAAQERRQEARRRAAAEPVTPEPPRLVDPLPGPDTDARDADWRAAALCAQVDTDLFFPDKGISAAEAKSICAACPVRRECLQWALDKGEKHGVWGGLTERQRRRLRDRKRAAA